MDTIILEGTKVSPSYHTYTFRMPHLSKWIRVMLDGWTNGVLTGLVRCDLVINGKVVDVVKHFVDSPGNPIAFIGGRPIRGFALIFSDVDVNVVVTEGCTGTVKLLLDDYPSVYNRYAGVVYKDEFTDMDGREHTLTYTMGRAVIDHKK